METLLVIGGIWLLIWIVRRVYKSSSQSATSSLSRPPPTTKQPEVYQPRPRGLRHPHIVFDNHIGNSGGSAPSNEALAGLHDAFTGAPLNAALGLYQCSRCTVYYHAESVEVLEAENNSRCVACGVSSIVALTATEARTRTGRDYRPDVVTLTNYRSHFNRVVTFEGTVRNIKVSRRGKDYAVMFENTSWTKGLKLVFFRGSVGKVGGPAFIRSLQGQNIRVRGLLLSHNVFGPEIIISERSMILETWR